MLASSQLDLVIGLDIRMDMVPTPEPTPTPFPMPFGPTPLADLAIISRSARGRMVQVCAVVHAVQGADGAEPFRGGNRRPRRRATFDAVTLDTPEALRDYLDWLGRRLEHDGDETLAPAVREALGTYGHDDFFARSTRALEYVVVSRPAAITGE